MHLLDLPQLCEQQTANTFKAPSWLWGAFRRRSISFADGLTDTQTRVFWLQSQGLTLDLRLPLSGEQPRLDLETLEPSSAMLAQTDLEAWYAHSRWQDQQLSWQGGCSFQLHNRWPEPAQLQRVGNCMMEFAPSGAYVEDWRLLHQQTSGPLVALELVKEVDLEAERAYPRQGVLMLMADYAGLVIGRKGTEIEVRLHNQGLSLKQGVQLSSLVEQRQLLAMEASIAQRVTEGDYQGEYRVQHSLYPQREGQLLYPLDGFEVSPCGGQVTQLVTEHGRALKRHWRVDTYLPEVSFSPKTAVNDLSAKAWREKEALTLDRYTRCIR